jgi:hypothetical protein
MKVMTFRTTESQIDILHKITHGTSQSASSIIRSAIDGELASILELSEIGGFNLTDKEKEELRLYLETTDFEV